MNPAHGVHDGQSPLHVVGQNAIAGGLVEART